MVARDVLKLHCTDFIYVEPGVKIDGFYYGDDFQLMEGTCSGFHGVKLESLMTVE